MRVLIINTSERIGGAAVAASRLMNALNNNGVKAKMLVRDKQTDQISVVKLDGGWKQKWNFLWERIVIWFSNYFSRKNLFSVDIANTGTDITLLPEFKEADVIHLHWINQGMLSLKNLKKIFDSNKPVVWTMHDMWPCTGVCHHARECEAYHTQCGNCPYLCGKKKKDLAYRTFRHKIHLYENARLHFVACSEWLKNQAEKSALLSGKAVSQIPNPLNMHLFKPEDKQIARKLLKLPQEKKLILFGSVKITDKRKGIDYLVEACRLLADKHPEMKENTGVVVVGTHSEELKELLPFPVYAQNYVSDEKRMVQLYNAADLYVTPSLEENLPNTIAEATACGTPCVGFHIGGIPEMIDHRINGYIANYRDAEDLANGIYWILMEANPEVLRQNARQKAQSTYGESHIALKYLNVYNKVSRKNE